MDFYSADTELHHRGHGKPMDSRKLQNNTYLERFDDDHIGLLLHRTYIATFARDGSVVLDTGGWRTVTTADRLGYVSGWVRFSGKYWSHGDSHWWLMFRNREWSKDWRSFWELQQDKDNWVPFFDGIHLHQETGEILSADEDIQFEMDHRDPGPTRREELNDYISLVTDPMMMASVAKGRMRGEVMEYEHSPYALRSHLVEEGYFGPDVILRALELDIAKRGELERSPEREAFAWLDAMEKGEEPPRYRSTIRSYIHHLNREVFA